MVYSDNSKVDMLERVLMWLFFNILHYLCLVVIGNANFCEGQKLIM